MSVTIVDFKERQNAAGESFQALILEGEIEMVQSQETGNFYATAKRASTTSTFSPERCKQLIGTTIPGTIEKVECDPYEFTIQESGEIITLSHTYEYKPEGAESTSMEDEVFERQKQNGAEKPALV